MTHDKRKIFPGERSIKLSVTLMLSLLYVIASIASLVNGACMLLFPQSWYTEFPADIPHTGPFNPHFDRDLVELYPVVALAFSCAAMHPDRASPVHLGLTVFFV